MLFKDTKNTCDFAIINLKYSAKYLKKKNSSCIFDNLDSHELDLSYNKKKYDRLHFLKNSFKNLRKANSDKTFFTKPLISGRSFLPHNKKDLYLFRNKYNKKKRQLVLIFKKVYKFKGRQIRFSYPVLRYLKYFNRRISRDNAFFLQRKIRLNFFKSSNVRDFDFLNYKKLDLKNDVVYKRILQKSKKDVVESKSFLKWNFFVNFFLISNTENNFNSVSFKNFFYSNFFNNFGRCFGTNLSSSSRLKLLVFLYGKKFSKELLKKYYCLFNTKKFSHSDLTSSSSDFFSSKSREDLIAIKVLNKTLIKCSLQDSNTLSNYQSSRPLIFSNKKWSSVSFKTNISFFKSIKKISNKYQSF